MSRFDAQAFDALCGPGFAPVRHAVVTTSTQTMLRNRGAAAGHLWRAAVADVQTQGRGRGGAQWSAAPGAALLMTVAAPLDLPTPLWPRASLMAGLAATELLRDRWQVPVWLKWPNDLLVLDQRTDSWRKLGGILCERVDHPGLAATWLCGIGLNLQRSPDWPADLAARALALEDLDRQVDRTELAAQLCLRLRRDVVAWQEAQGALPLQRLQALLAFRGCEVELDLGAEGRRWARLEGIDETGGLYIRAGDRHEVAVPLALIAARSAPPWHAPAAAGPGAPRLDE